MDMSTRRVITGFNDRSRSVVVSDGPIEESWSMFQMWGTARSPADLSFPPETSGSGPKLEPPASGTTFFLVRIPPVDPSLSEDELADVYARLGSASARPDTSRSAWMHRTKTIDYIIILEGRLTLLLDDGEVELKPFDVVIQRATNHAWINKGTDPVLMAAVLIDCEAPPEWSEQSHPVFNG